MYVSEPNCAKGAVIFNDCLLIGDKTGYHDTVHNMKHFSPKQ